MSRSRRTLLSTLMICAATAGGTLPAARSLAAQIAPAAAGPDSGAFGALGALSPAGRRAMLDVSVARGALFDGRTDEAARLIHDARVRFDQERGDDTAILKPETELVPSPDLRASASLVTLVSSTVPASHPFHEFHDARVVAWLPYGGEVVLRDAPEAGAMHEPHDTADARRRKAAALAAANAALSGGRRAEALQLLARAKVGVDCTLDIVPLDATVRRIGQADSLMRAGRYYEAGQMLHRIERSARRERVDLGAVAHAIPTRHAG